MFLIATEIKVREIKHDCLNEQINTLCACGENQTLGHLFRTDGVD